MVDKTIFRAKVLPRKGKNDVCQICGDSRRSLSIFSHQQALSLLKSKNILIDRNHFYHCAQCNPDDVMEKICARYVSFEHGL